MPQRGAGGTSGGTGRFLLGFAMLVAGAYLFFRSIVVTTSHFGLGYALFGFGGFQVTSGMVCVPFIFGVGMLFYNSKNLIGWFLAGGSLVALIAGVIMSIDFSLRVMSAFDLIVIFVLFFGGLGLFLSSLKDYEEPEKKKDEPEKPPARP